jgi:3-hydroxyisobutyrate dehydrogenase
MTLDPQAVTIGFVGLGNMGVPMATRLAAAGFRLLVHDINAGALSAFVAAVPAATAAAPVEMAAKADVMVTMLPTGAIVRDFLFQPSPDSAAPADAMPPGTIVVDMSSSEPVGTRETGALLADRGIHMIDAPVSGGVTRARAGTLAVLVGGEEEIVERLRPLFAAMCGPLIHVGGLGAGHAMKALNNFVSAAGLTAACEALRVAERFGIDGQRAVDALNASSGRNNSTETKLSQFVLSGTYGSGFTAGLMKKDLGIALGLIDALHIDAPLAHAFVPIWSDLTETIGPGADHTEIAKAITDRTAKKTS